ncbi:MAG: hypothetical protein AAFQ11_12710, partial [Pseudomonadota bacterium]
GAPAGTNVAGVEAAQLAADVATAEADATAALADLANYANDSVLTPLEKQRLRERRAEIVEEYDALLPRAQGLGIAASTISNFTAAYDAHINFLTAVGIDNPGNSVVVRADLIGGAEDYAFWLGAVNDAVTEKAAQLAEWDGITGSNKADDNATRGAPAGTNVAGVEAAQLAADVATAEADATAALADLANYANDSVLTPLEKQRLRERRAEIVEEYDALLPRAQGLGIAASTISNFTAAYDAHINFLTAVGIDNPGNSVVVRADLIGGAEDYAFWLGAVNDAVTEKAAQLAEWDGITGSNKADDNADVTAEATRTIDTQFADIEIRQFEAGNQGNRLIPFTAKRGGVSLDGGDWEVLQALLGPGSATINQASGTLTLSGIVQSGTIELEYEHTDGVKTREQFTVRFVAQDPTVITITPSPSVPTWTKNQTTSLGVTHVAREGSTNLTGGTWALDATSPTITAGINATSGTVTVSNATANGSYTVRYTHTNGSTEAKTVNVSVYEANDPGAPNDPNTSIP